METGVKKVLLEVTTDERGAALRAQLMLDSDLWPASFHRRHRVSDRSYIGIGAVAPCLRITSIYSRTPLSYATLQHTTSVMG